MKDNNYIRSYNKPVMMDHNIYFGTTNHYVDTKGEAKFATVASPSAVLSNINADNVTISNNLFATHFDLQTVAQLGGSFYVSPTIRFPNSGTTLVVAKSGSTLTLTITDSSITSTTMAGIVWTSGSAVKVSGTINGVTTGTMDGTVTSINTSSHVITLSVSGGNADSITAGTYNSSQFSDFSVMVYQRRDGSNDYRVGIWMNCYDIVNSSASIRIYGGNDSAPNVMIGNLTSAGLGTVNNLTPTGWGLFAQNAFLHGTVVANSGRIGGFTLSENALYSGSATPSSGNVLIVPAGTTTTHKVGGKETTGWVITSGTTFGVTDKGELFASAGRIGGLTIKENWMYTAQEYPNDNNLFIRPTGTSTSYTVAGTKRNGWVITSGDTFGVTKDGSLYSTSGQIGGFSIGATKLSNGTLGSNNSLFMGTTDLGSAKIADNTTDTWRLAVGSNFGVTNTGAVYAISGKIGGWTLADTSLTSGTWGEDDSVMLCIGTKGSKSIGGSGSIPGWVISAGSTFGVTKDGKLYSTSGKIGGFSIGATELSNGEIGAPNSVFLSAANLDSTTIAGETADNWRLTVGTYFGVKSDGSVYATSGKIGGFKITASSIENGTIGTANSVFISTGTSDKASIGGSASISGWAFTAGNTFGVTKGGALYAGTGKIGGFILSNGALYSDSHSAWDTNSNGIYIGTSGLSGGKNGAWWFWKDGSARIGAMTLSSAGVLSVPAANISGELTASQIAAGAITASKLSITIGGNNLLRNSHADKTGSSTPWIWSYGPNPPKSGDKLTFQVKGSSLGSSQQIVTFGVTHTISLVYNSTTGTYVGTFTLSVNSSDTYFRFNPGSTSATCDWVKLEYGDMATPWSPSPDEAAGFDVDATAIHTSGVAVTSNADNSVALSSADFTRTINSISRSDLRFAIGAHFGVTGAGALYSSSGVIGGLTIGSNYMSYGTIGKDASTFIGAVNYGLSHNNAKATVAGLTTDTWRLTVGSNFGVTGSGMYATGGKIGGFTIGASSIASTTSNVAFTISSTTNYSAVLIRQNNSYYTRIGLSEIEVVGGTGTTISAGTISTNEIQAAGEIQTTAVGSGGTVKLHSGVDNGLFVQNRLTDGTNQEVRFILNNNSNAGIYDVTKKRWALVYNINNGQMASNSQISVSSDERIKKIYRHLNNDHKKLFMELDPIEFSFIDKPDEIHFGFGAQTTELSMRKLGFGSEYNLVSHPLNGEMDTYGRRDSYYMNYTEALMLSVPVVQDHEKEIAKLKTKIEELENKLSQLTQ